MRSGRVTDVGDPATSGQGRIDPKGRVPLQIVKGTDMLQTSGILNGKAGGGEWVCPTVATRAAGSRQRCETRPITPAEGLMAAAGLRLYNAGNRCGSGR